MKKTIRFKNKSIINAPEQSVLIKCENEPDFKKLIRTLSISNIILNHKVNGSPAILQGGVFGSSHMRQKNASIGYKIIPCL